MKITITLLIIAVLSLAIIQLTDGKMAWGKCDDTIKVMQNFSLNDFQGDWIEVDKYKNCYEKGVCQKINVRFNPNNVTEILITGSEFRKGQERTMNSSAVPSEADRAK